jgi:hypothetical protein
MTILMPVYLRPSCHRHGERHRRNALPKRLTRLLLQPNPTNPTHRARSPVPVRLSNL